MEFTQGAVLYLLCVVVTQIKGKETDFQSIYRRIPDNYLKAIPQKVVENATVELCSAHCAMEVEFECKSFDIANRNKECHLHNHTHSEPLIGLQHARGFDHYRTAYDRLFNRIPNHVITLRHNRNIRGLTVEECARRCILEMSFKCVGFDFEERRRNCWLTDKVVHDVGGLKRRSNTDYYERKSHGALGSFINYGYGSLQTLEGVQTHGKIVLGVNLDACAQLCLAETSFVCASFDYVFDEQSCQLSQYIAANVHGMRTEYDTQYQVMHYEVIGEYLQYFYPTPYASVLGNNDRTVRRVTPETCARKCLEEREFICRSFDYQIQKGTCLLSHVTGSDAGGLYTPEGVHVHHFEMKPSLDCGGIQKAERGSLASPNWPRHYIHRLNCTWLIEVPDFKIIRFELYHMDLGWQTDDACHLDNDVLSITEKSKEGKQSITCLQNFQTQLSTSTNTANVTFTTNAEYDAQGFRIFYFSDWPCKVTLTENHGEFASPRWPNTYQAMTSCHWHIQAPVNSNIFLRFSSLELEDHMGSTCRTAYDKIDIYDGNNTTGNHLKTLCGNKRPASFTSTGNSLYIVFLSDSRVQANGFHASYTFILPVTSTSTTVVAATAAATAAAKSTAKENSPNYSSGENDNTQENVHIDNIPMHTVSPFQSEDVDNMSMAINMAMVGEDERDDIGDVIKLTAIFVEPAVDEGSNDDENITITLFGKTSDDIGRGGNPDYGVVHTNRDLNAIILGVFAAFVSLLFMMSVAFLLVCRYYRRRLPKLRHGTNMHSPEENLSLCHNNGSVHGADEYKDEEDVDDAARLPLPGDHEPLQNVEFHNRLYMDSSIPDMDNLTRSDIDSVDIDLIVTHDDDGTATRGNGRTVTRDDGGTVTQDDGGTNIGRGDGTDTCNNDGSGVCDARTGSDTESRDNDETRTRVGRGTITRDDCTSECRIITEQASAYTVHGRALPDYLCSLSSSAARETVNTGVYIDCLTTV